MPLPPPDDLKERVRDATDIVALLGSYLDLRPRGSRFFAICPFHSDSRPSLEVNPVRQTWKCWPCDKGGDVFSFVMMRESVDFREALRILAERAGIEFTSTGRKADPGSPNDKATLYKAMAWAEQQFHRFFLEGSEAKDAREYVAERQINDESIRRFQIGYAPNEWSWLMDRAKSTPYSPAVLEALGLVIKNDKGRRYDRFRGRVMFPIRDTQNRAIAVGGRILPKLADDKAAKYINSPETRLYSKSNQLYALNLGREQLAAQQAKKQTRNAIVMEGYTDVVLASQFGVECPLAVCGTALGEKHLELLRRFADRVTLILDGDQAGRDRAKAILELFVAGQMELRVVTLPDNLDPADFVIQNGTDALNDLMQSAPDALDFCVESETVGIDLANDTLRAVPALERILGTIGKAPAAGADTPAVFRLREQQILARLARMFRLDETSIRESLQETRVKTAASRTSRFDVPTEEKKLPSLHGWEGPLFMLLILQPDFVASVIEKVSPAEMRTPTGARLLKLYEQLEVEGKEASFQNVMALLDEDPKLKTQFVGLADSADQLHAKKNDDELAEQLNQLLARFEAHRQEQTRRQHIADLDSGALKDQEVLEHLSKIFESKRLEL